MASINNHSAGYSTVETGSASTDEALKHLARLLGISTAKQMMHQEFSDNFDKSVGTTKVRPQSDTES